MHNMLLQYHSLIFITTLCAAGFMQAHGQLYEPLLNLNPLDNTTINTTSEYFDMDRVIFLANMTEITTPNGSWTYIYLVITRGEIDIDEMVDVYPEEAVDAGRADTDYRGLFRRTRITPSDLLGYDININLVIDGMQLEVNDGHNASGGAVNMNDTLIGIALSSSGYIVREHPGYGPRDICIIADDLMSHTTACLTLYFIGYNDDPPVVTYEATSNATFTEGHPEHIPIITGDLNVTDQDHPTRYPMVSAQVQIEGYRTGYPEFLSVTYEHPGFLYNYNMDTGVLTISGNATTAMYEQVLSNLTYFNNMIEPLGDSRSIIITVEDGKFRSDPISVLIIINNTNDAPAISLDGVEDPVNQRFSANYTEGTGAQRIVSDLLVVDTDPNSMIRRVVVTLTNPIDGSDEEISISGPGMGLTITPASPSHSIEISGIAAENVYTDVLRTLTYQHLDSDPGNPSTMEPRYLEFYVEDDQNAANVMNSTLELTIIPVNDPPILLFVSDPAMRADPTPVLSGVTQMTFTYTEDDPPLNFGQDIYLRDVDGNISLALLNLTNLLNGEQDHVYADPVLLSTYGVAMEIVNTSQSSRVIMLNTVAEGVTPTAFEEVLRSLSYINRYPDNRVTDGQRIVTIVATDTTGAESGSIIVDITVMDRNDGPVVDVGGGDSMDFVTTFVENGPSIPIALSHLIDIMDEEMHNISSLNVELIATNGNLDPTDSIFLRSPMSLLFLNNFVTPPNTTFIHIALNATVEVYEQALRAIYFDNSEIEPTIFNATGANLTRVVVIRITDTNFPDSGSDNAELGTTTTEIRIGINIQPINDNPPRILILAEPQGCATGSVNVSNAQANIRRRRRDVRAASSIRKRSIQGLSSAMAPRLTSADVHLTKVSDLIMCIQNITIGFDINTSIPIVEVPAKLESLVSFDVQKLNVAKKFGRWMDHRSMAIFFVECVTWDSSTTSGKERPIHIMFEANEDECDWSTQCTTGVCFANNTGCPVTGSYLLKYNQSDADKTTNPGNDYSENNGYYHHVVTPLVCILAVIIFASFLSCIVATRYRKGSQKVITLEDVDSSTTMALSPIAHKQQPEAKDVHSRVQDLYPPVTDPHNSRSLQVVIDNNDHKIISRPEPLLPCIQKPPETSSVANTPAWPPPSAVSANSTEHCDGVHQDVDGSTAPIEGRTADTVCMGKEATKDKVKHQSPSKRRKKGAKTSSPKTVNETSSRDKVELRRPVSDDICNWLQLEDSESKELDERLQSVSKPCDQSHDLQAITGINGSQDTEQSKHCQTTSTNCTKECRLCPQRSVGAHAQAPSQFVQQQRLSHSETTSSVQSTTCKH